MDKFDVVVIGGGPGGYPAAIRAAQLGAKVALVEKEALGGTCLNWGCIPTKTLIASSDLYFRMMHSESLGLKPGKCSFDYGAMVKRKGEVVKKLQGGVEMLLGSNKVEIIRGSASFASRNKLVIVSGSGKKARKLEIETKNTIIATGSTSVMPGFLPKNKRVLESRAFLDLDELPESLLVLGGGVIGCEFACMAAQLGVKVTIVEMLDDILIVLDQDLRRELRRQMEGELGITILTGAPMKDITVEGDSVRGIVADKPLSAAMLLVSVGRKAYTDGLALDKAGIIPTDKGQIEIDKYCRTSAAGVYAIGDVTAGSTQLAHAATSQGITAADNAVSGKRKPMESVVPACIFTVPEAGSVGLTEQKAREKGISVKTGKFMLSGLGKAMASGETGGFVKWIADPDTGQLLGAHAVGAHATELISEAATAIRAELTLEELGSTVHCHPTFSESWMEAAHAAHGECIHQPARKK